MRWPHRCCGWSARSLDILSNPEFPSRLTPNGYELFLLQSKCLAACDARLVSIGRFCFAVMPKYEGSQVLSAHGAGRCAHAIAAAGVYRNDFRLPLLVFV